MKQHQEVPRPLAITVIAIMIVCLLIVIFQPIVKKNLIQSQNKTQNEKATY